MTKHHRLFLRQEIARLGLSETDSVELNRLLSLEVQNQDSLMLKIAKAERSPSKNATVLNELHRQKANSDLKVEALEYAKSEAAFREGLDETPPQPSADPVLSTEPTTEEQPAAQPTIPQSEAPTTLPSEAALPTSRPEAPPATVPQKLAALESVPQPAPPVQKRRSWRRSLKKREKVIRSAIRLGKKGRKYAAYLDEHGLRTEESWQNNIDNPCPKTHVKAYDDPEWRQAIQREKSRVAKRMKSK
jgi:hypothetical protein